MELFNFLKNGQHNGCILIDPKLKAYNKKNINPQNNHRTYVIFYLSPNSISFNFSNLIITKFQKSNLSVIHFQNYNEKGNCVPTSHTILMVLSVSPQLPPNSKSRS